MLTKAIILEGLQSPRTYTIDRVFGVFVKSSRLFNKIDEEPPKSGNGYMVTAVTVIVFPHCVHVNKYKKVINSAKKATIFVLPPIIINIFAG